MPTQTLDQLQARLQAFRASKQAAPATAPAAPATATPSAPDSSGVDPARLIALQSSLAQYNAKGGQPSSTPAIPKDNPSALAEFAKGLFSAPATIVARPFQAVAELAGATSEQVDAATKKIPLVGGLIAPVPQNAADVEKDVGRGIQTVALGTGAPIAGGAAFGLGASLEQGNDLFSVQTAFNTALGAAGGKVLDLVGKPLLNAAGKVVGTITPQVLKDVAAGGTQAIARFATDHQLLGGALAKPSEKLAAGFQAVDDSIGAGAKKLAGGAKAVVQKQYPGLNPTAHYQAVNEKDFLRPTTVNEPRFAKAQNIYNDAKTRGINLEKTASEQGIIHDQIAEGGKYNTSDVADNLREGNYQVGNDVVRPAIKQIEPGVRLVPVSEVRGAMLDRVRNIPASEIDAEDRATLIKQITKRYAPGSAADLAHPNGYSLTDLHDARIVSGKNGKFKPGADPSTALTAQRAREEGRVFADIFDKTIPEDAGLAGVRKFQEGNFRLADYLDSLHGKNVPEGITKKAVRLFGRAAGGVLGAKFGGFTGYLFGSRGGDMLFASFETLPNPIKVNILTKAFANRAKSPVFDTLSQYLGKRQTEQLLMKALPGPGGSSFKEVPPTLFATPGGKITPNKAEAIDVTAVEKGTAKTPKAGPAYKTRLKEIQNKLERYLTPKEIDSIDFGATPKRPLKKGEIDLTTAAPPNVFSPELKNKLEKYLTPDEMAVIQMGTVPKKPKNLNDIKF